MAPTVSVPHYELTVKQSHDLHTVCIDDTQKSKTFRRQSDNAKIVCYLKDFHPCSDFDTRGIAKAVKGRREPLIPRADRFEGMTDEEYDSADKQIILEFFSKYLNKKISILRNPVEAVLFELQSFFGIQESRLLHHRISASDIKEAMDAAPAHHASTAQQPAAQPAVAPEQPPQDPVLAMIKGLAVAGQVQQQVNSGQSQINREQSQINREVSQNSSHQAASIQHLSNIQQDQGRVQQDQGRVQQRQQHQISEVQGDQLLLRRDVDRNQRESAQKFKQIKEFCKSISGRNLVWGEEEEEAGESGDHFIDSEQFEEEKFSDAAQPDENQPDGGGGNDDDDDDDGKPAAVDHP